MNRRRPAPFDLSADLGLVCWFVVTLAATFYVAGMFAVLT